jgi:predicted dehydrogenase
MEKIRTGFIGLGGIARQRHVPGLRRIPEVEIVAVANRSRESAERAAREFGIPDVYDAWEQIIERPDIDAVFIGTWPYLHRAASVAALDAGKHVFCQARMAMNAIEARAMHASARKTGLVAMLCPVPFGLSVDATVARLVREHYLGSLRLVCAHSLSDAYLDPNTPMNWRKDHRFSGLNALTLGMYIEVIHRWFGATCSVSARTQVFVPERIDAEGNLVQVRIPDQFLVNAEMAPGVPVQYTISGASVHKLDAIDIHGTEGRLHYDVAKDTLFSARDGGPLEPAPIPAEERYDVAQWRVEEDFINAIRHGTPYHPDFEDGLNYMEVVQAIYDSAEDGCVRVLERTAAEN